MALGGLRHFLVLPKYHPPDAVNLIKSWASTTGGWPAPGNDAHQPVRPIHEAQKGIGADGEEHCAEQRNHGREDQLAIEHFVFAIHQPTENEQEKLRQSLDRLNDGDGSKR